MSDLLEWKDPPPDGRGNGRPHGRPALTDWFAVADQLKANPRRWALVLTDVFRTHGSRINSGANTAFQDGLYEAIVRFNPETSTNGDSQNRGDLYVRYLGPLPENWAER